MLVAFAKVHLTEHLLLQSPHSPISYCPNAHSESQMNPYLRFWLTLAFLVFPPIYLAWKPAHFTPIVDVLVSIFLTFLAYSMGQASEAIKIAQQANDRWLPQAESVIRRLLTLHTNVHALSETTKSSCSNAECDLPELNNPDMRPVRIKMQSDCAAISQRLDDIANQLEDAVADWERFVMANCIDEDCGRISEEIDERRQFFQSQFAANQDTVGVDG